MDVAKTVSQVDSERMYRHVLKLEGTRHPIDTPHALNEAANYIRLEFERYGLSVNEQEFKVEGFEGTFKNIEAVTGDRVGPELLIVSHYDTIEDCPGADDNGSAVAVMLETARVLAHERVARSIRFISFSLEELNPARVLRVRKISQGLGLTDEHDRYTTQHTQKLMKRLLEFRVQSYAVGKSPAEALSEFKSQFNDQMSESEVKYVEEVEEMYKGITLASFPGKTGIMGSSFWVEEALRTKSEVLGVVCFDTVGYTSSKERSQTLPKGMDPRMFETYNVRDINIGDFLAAIGDANSGRLVQSFCAQCRLDSISLPYACLQVPFSYEAIAQKMYDLLRSDHAPFWRAGIPALFLTDSGDFRNPYYHTRADTIDKLDFDFLAKVCKATIATAIDLTTSS